MATSEDTKQWIAFWIMLPFSVWAIAWGIVTYNRIYLDAGYQQVAVPGQAGTVWQKSPTQAEKGTNGYPGK